MNTRRHLMSLTLTLGFAALAAPLPALAADAFPERPIKMVVAFAPGGPTDVLARILATAMSKSLGQQVVVDNRAGAGGLLGTLAVTKAPADGYTLLFAGDATLTVIPQMNPNKSYDVDKELLALRLVTSQVNVLVANSSKGLPDVKAVLAKARAEPGKLTYGSAGSGSPSHLVGALFQSENSVELSHIPYKGAGPAMSDLMGGQLDMMFVGMPIALQQAARKEVTLLAVTGDKRSPAMPQVPTFAEAGVKGLGAESAVWWSVMAPAGVAGTVQAKLVAGIRAALSDPDAQRAFAAQGVNVIDLDAATTSAWIARDRQRWSELIEAKKIVAD